jgi:hypothetical protein
VRKNNFAEPPQANIGVGIMGREGSHAAMASDYVLYRFSHLKVFPVVQKYCICQLSPLFLLLKIVLFLFFCIVRLACFSVCCWFMDGTTNIGQAWSIN